MPIDFATELNDCDWIFDLFACGFDHVSRLLDVPRESDIDVAADVRLIDRLAKTIERSDGVVPDEVWQHLDVPGEQAALTGKPFLRRLLTALLAIDQACTSLNFYSGYQDRRFWNRVVVQFERNQQRLNRGSRHVILKPRRRFPHHAGAWWQQGLTRGALEELEVRGSHWGSVFTNLCRVPEVPGCELEHRVLSARQELSEVDWSNLRIGMVPLIEDLAVDAQSARLLPGPLQIRTNAANDLIVDFAAPDCEELCANACTALRFLAERQVQIVLFPEAVVPDAVVDRLKMELRRLSTAGSRYPALVLAGTFGRPSPGGPTLPYNQAVVLNNRGDELWRQSKMHPYGMQVYEQRRYGLDAVFAGRTALEQITTHPRRLVFCDSRLTGTRMVVAICEDSAQDDPCLQAIRGMQPNLVLIPVMAGALLGDRGFAATVGELARAPGALAAVTNSGALPRSEWRNRAMSGTPPMGVVGIPLLGYVASHRSYELLDRTHRAGVDGPEVLIFECPGLEAEALPS
jgi:hypothetical protein